MEYLKPVDFSNKKRVDIDLYNMDMRRILVKDPRGKPVEDRDSEEKKTDNDGEKWQDSQGFPEDGLSINKPSSGSFVIPPKNLKEHTPFLQNLSRLPCIMPEIKKSIISDYYYFQPKICGDFIVDTLFIFKLMSYISSLGITYSSSLADIVNYFIYLGYYYNFMRFNNLNLSIKNADKVKMKKNINVNFLNLSINNPPVKPMFYKDKMITFSSL